MANNNFVVRNGLTVGTTTTIDGTLGTIITSGNVVAANSTNSTSTTTGALVVVGGAGIGGNLYISGNLVSTGTTSIKIPSGTTDQRPGAASTGMIRYNSTLAIYEGYGSGSSWASLGGVRSADGKAYIQSETSPGAADNVIRVYAGDSGTSTQVMWASTSNIKILPTTTSTSSTTGAFQVAGGAGIVGTLFVGGATTLSTATTGGLQAQAIGNVTPGTAAFTTGTFSSTLGVTGATTLSSALTYGGVTLTNAVTGTGSMVLNTSPSLITPVLGVATATSINGLTVTSSTGTLTLTNAKTLSVSNTLTFTGTDSSSVAFGTGGTVAYQGDTLAQFAATTSSQLAGVISDETGTGVLVFGTAPTFTSNITVPIIVKSGTTGVGNIGSSSNYFDIIFGKATTATYADLAENYQADNTYAPGVVLMFGGDQEVTIATADTTAVAGVVSQNPAHLMNGGLSGNHVVAVALQGRVPCNVIGPIKKGDLMVSAGFGYAKSSANPKVGQVIGKALSDFAGSKGQVEVVVGRV